MISNSAATPKRFQAKWRPVWREENASEQEA
jgi:hypothetical protein